MKLLKWTALSLTGLALVLWLAVQLSPWPSVLLIRYVFSKNDAASAAGLEKHVPPGIAGKHNLSYGGGTDESFDVFYPEGTSSPLPAIVWVHGGGWVAGSKGAVANYLKILAAEGYTVIGLDYTTAPAGRYPEPLRQINTALAHIQAHAAELNVDAARIVIAGDSAGAQLSAQMAAMIADPGYAREVGIMPSVKPGDLSAVVLFCGAYDVRAVDLHGDFAWFLRTILWAYSGTKDFMGDKRFRLASVIDHLSPRFPSAFISGGNADPLTPQSVHLAEKLQGMGVKVDTLFFPENRQPPLPHEYQFNLDDEAGRLALERLKDFLRQSFRPD